MKRYEVLEHKADLKIRAFGKVKEELFLNALLGMAESMKPEAKKPPEEIKREIKIKSFDFPALLVDFLSEALYSSQVNREAYFNVKFKEFSDDKLTGELLGQKAERFDEDIKAVTYHELDVLQRKDGIWEATVLFDI